MGKPTIYGITRSRAFRSLWAAEELGLDCDQAQISFMDGSSRTPEFLAINPMGAVPALVDGELKMSESLAINLYLAKKHADKGLWPVTLEDEARVFQWTLWAATEVEPSASTILFHAALLPEDQRDAGLLAAAQKKVAKPLAVLDQHVNGRDYLLGDAFTIADLNVASVMSWLQFSRHDMSAWPHLTAWLGRCLKRPAVKSVNARAAA
jgi:glutathione S-transferase